MSLLSLRKHNLQSETVKRLRHKTRRVNAEQFIDEATSYANGQGDNVVAFQSNNTDETQRNELTQPESNLAAKIAPKTEQKIAPQTHLLDTQMMNEQMLNEQVLNKHADNDKIPFRRATFTLSEPCIESLNEHAKAQQCAKSHLIRMLIRHFDELPANQQQAILTQQKD